MSKKGQRKIGQCIYCGNVAQISKDHVIPKSLFVRPLPSNLITVPCCDSCNNNKSQNDDFLRDLLTTDVFGNQHPTAQQIFQEKVLRSNERNSSTIAKIVSKEARTEPFYTRKGIYLGNIITAPIEPERVKTIFTTIIRGLYFDARHQQIPDSYDFEIRRFYPWEFNEV